MDEKKVKDEDLGMDEEVLEEDSVEAEVLEEEATSSSESESVNDELEDLKSTLVRLQADFNNYRTRVNKEKEDMRKYAASSLIEKLLSVLDNFDRALDTIKSDGDLANDSCLEGFELIQKELVGILKDSGLEEIESTGAVFDPNFHNAVLMEESDEVESGKIIETFQKGYKLSDRVLRPSMVKVSK